MSRLYDTTFSGSAGRGADPPVAASNTRSSYPGMPKYRPSAIVRTASTSAAPSSDALATAAGAVVRAVVAAARFG